MYVYAHKYLCTYIIYKNIKFKTNNKIGNVIHLINKNSIIIIIISVQRVSKQNALYRCNNYYNAVLIYVDMYVY